MSIKLKATVIYKKDGEDSGLLFTVGDDSGQMVRVRGLINEIVQELSEGKDYNELKERILSEYEVDETRFNSDMEAFRSKLAELNFLEN